MLLVALFAIFVSSFQGDVVTFYVSEDLHF